MTREREQALEAAAALGKCMAEETFAHIERRGAIFEANLNYLRNTEAAARILNTRGGGSAIEVQRMVYEAGAGRIEPPRPRLVLVKL